MLETLKKMRMKEIEDKAIEFAETIFSECIESAGKGYGSLRKSISKENPTFHILTNKTFLELLKSLLEEIKVELEIKEHVPLIRLRDTDRYYTYALIFTWSHEL